MKRISKKREQGSVLVMTLLACMVIATVLASYLAFISVRYNLTVRSTGWNAAIPVLEAGVEEAFTHLNNDATPTANGWTAGVVGGQPVHTKNRNLTDGSYYDVTIYNATSKNPMIYSSGFVPAPLSGGYTKRTVRVTAARLKTFPAAISANGKVSLGGGAIMDSYKSSLGAYSTNKNGLGTNGAIATDFGGSPAISVGNAHIYGTLTTGPLGTVAINNGTVGDATWNATHTGIQPGFTDDDMNVIFPPNVPPTGTFLPPPLYTYGTGKNITNVYELGNDTYQMSSFSSSDYFHPMIVKGNATLYVKGDVKVTGDGYIMIQTNASLTLYAEGKNNVISGTSLVNITGKPANFSYIGVGNNAKLDISGQGSFVGTINAPQTDLSMSGTAQVYGAAIINTFSSSGSASLHYDEDLDAFRKLRVKAWKEL